MAETNATEKILNAALGYLSRGWVPMVLRPHSKAPVLPNWTKLRLSRKELSRLFAKHPDANLGILTGTPSGVVAIDIDSKAALRRFEDVCGGQIPQTTTVVSARGPKFLFSYSGSLPTLHDVFDEKIDVVADGAQVMMPPSIHPITGMPVTFTVGPDEIIPLPESLLSALREWISARNDKTPQETETQGRNATFEFENLFRVLLSVVALKENGEGTAHCPFHDDKDPSFTFNADKGVWICHAGCGKGTAYDLTKEMFNRGLLQKIPRPDRLPLLCPPGYELSSDGITKAIEKKGKDGDTETGYKPIASRGVYVLGYSQRVEGDQRISLTLGWPLGRRLHSRAVEREVVKRKDQLLTLAAFGAPFHALNAAECVSFLDAYEEWNRYLLWAWLELVSGRCGWVQLGKKKAFVLAQGIGESIILRPEGDEEQRLCASFRVRGKIEAWLDLLAEAYRASPVAGFFLDAAFAAPLLRPLGARSFAVLLIGPSGIGKTALLKLAASPYGSPDGLVLSLNATMVGIEHFASFLCDLPMPLDELQISQNPDLRQGLAYLIAEGVGRLRGKRTGGLQSTPRWRTVALMTGEEHLSRAPQFEGQKARLLEIFSTNLLSPSLAAKLHHTTALHHGHVGRAYLEHLVDFANNAERMAQLRGLWRDFQGRVSEMCPDELRSRVQAISLVCLAGALLRQFFLGERKGDPVAGVLAQARAVIEIMATYSEPAAYGDNSIEIVLNWITEHRARFGVYPHNVMRDMYGTIHVANREVWLLPTVFRREMDRMGHSADRILDDLLARGFLVTDGDKKHRAPQRTLDHKKQRVYILKVPPERAAGWEAWQVGGEDSSDGSPS